MVLARCNLAVKFITLQRLSQLLSVLPLYLIPFEAGTWVVPRFHLDSLFSLLSLRVCFFAKVSRFWKLFAHMSVDELSAPMLGTMRRENDLSSMSCCLRALINAFASIRSFLESRYRVHPAVSRIFKVFYHDIIFCISQLLRMQLLDHLHLAYCSSSNCMSLVCCYLFTCTFSLKV